MAEPVPGTIFGGYVAATGPITQAIQTEVIVEITKLKALIPNPDTSVPAANRGGNFDAITPILAHQLRAEIDALIVALDATPIS